MHPERKLFIIFFNLLPYSQSIINLIPILGPINLSLAPTIIGGLIAKPNLHIQTVYHLLAMSPNSCHVHFQQHNLYPHWHLCVVWEKLEIVCSLE